MKYLVVVSIAFAVFLMGCQGELFKTAESSPSKSSKESNMFFSKKYSVRLGESGQDWVNRYAKEVRIDRQPAGLNFYDIEWERPRGVVTIEHGKYSFQIDDVLRVTGVYDVKLPSEGISDINISSGMSVPPPGLGSHDEARLKTYAIVQRIEQAGWKLLTSTSGPRLRGKERFDYVVNINKYNGMGIDYVPSFDEWMKIKDRTNWYFYADHQYLKFGFQRDSSFLDPTKPGAYLLSFELITESEEFKNYVEPEFRKTYRDKLPNELAGVIKSRLDAEAKLKLQGLTIDTGYEDPPWPEGIKPLPVEQYVPNPKFLKPSPAAAPVYGDPVEPTEPPTSTTPATTAPAPSAPASAAAEGKQSQMPGEPDQAGEPAEAAPPRKRWPQSDPTKLMYIKP
jgi:hypothetical protein